MLALLGAALIAAPPLAAQEAGISVAEMSFCTEVQNRQPVAPADSFAADVANVCCFTKITGASGEASVAHVWYHGDKEMARVELPVRSSAWQTWSRKQIGPGRSGEWRVDVVGADGKVLKSATFMVRASSGM